MSEEKNFPDHWIGSIIQEILQRKVPEINLSTGKTPSGHIHLGILREVIICDTLKKILEKQGFKVNFRLFFDNLDPIKRFPEYIPKEFAKKHLGKPMVFTPNPFEGSAKNYAEYFGNELAVVFPQFGINIEIVWTDQVYNSPKMKELIRIALKKNDQAKDIVSQFLTASMTDEQKDDFDKQFEGWTGGVVPCEKCGLTIKKQSDGSIVPNRVIEYNENDDTVTYTCPNCNHSGVVKISDNLVKLSWRMDWPAKWTLYQTTCEPAGKDHCTPGGSYDTGLELCRKIYGYQGPVKLAYEWLRLGDQDMKTSKGIIFTPKKYLEMADPVIIRMLILMTNPNKHISFRIEELNQYYNEFERIERIYYGLEKGSSPEEEKEIRYIYPYIIIDEITNKCPQHIPFKLLTVLTQLKDFMGEEAIYQKAVEYMQKEKFDIIISKEKFMIQIERAWNWIEEIQRLIKESKDPGQIKKLNTKVELFSILNELTDIIKSKLEPVQKKALEEFLKLTSTLESFTEENMKDIMMKIQNDLGIKPLVFFQAFYMIILGNSKGPRIGPLLAILNKNWVINRIKEAIK
jgi:lysyl-tRNA synthetase class 1